MRYFYFYTAFVLFLIFSSFSLSFAVTLEMSASDKSKLPSGPSPANYPKNKRTDTVYARSMAQTFTFTRKRLSTDCTKMIISYCLGGPGECQKGIGPVDLACCSLCCWRVSNPNLATRLHEPGKFIASLCQNLVLPN